MLAKNFKKYFLDEDSLVASYEWIRDLFQDTPDGLSTSEEEIFIDFTSSEKLKGNFVINRSLNLGSSSNKPSWQDISAYSPTTKQYWALWNSLHLRNGVLYRKFESEDGKKTFSSEGAKIRSRGKLHRYNVGAPLRTTYRFRYPETSAKGLRLVISTYLLSWTTSRNGPRSVPHSGSRKPPTVAEAVVQHWILDELPLQLHSDQGKKFRLCGIEGVALPDTPSSPEEVRAESQARFLKDVHNLARERINLRTERWRLGTTQKPQDINSGDKVWFYSDSTQRTSLATIALGRSLYNFKDNKRRRNPDRKSTNSKPRVVHYDELAPYYGHNS
ncbi:retrovirus-related Pol polyprotein from transposon 412 [Trichonephila clavipes]|nr:retrovirus-related Pol polyprotein from transposon 412 [Trichonephila clavipes]